jgi:RNA polymerase sigma-70 factor (ECF subfamily)
MAEGSGDTLPDRVPVVRAVEDFEVFYRREYPKVATLTMVLTRDASAAEDLTQEAFLRANRDWDRVGSYEHPGAWVRRVATNLAMSRFRRLRTETKALLRFTGSIRVAEMDTDAAEFWAEVRRLPARQAQVVALHYVEDRSVDDIAATLGVSPASVKTHLQRARRTLAERFGSVEDAP